MVDFPIQPSGDKNFQDVDPNAREMSCRGLNYGKAKLALECMYQDIKGRSITITHISDAYGCDRLISTDDCVIHYDYEKDKNKEFLPDKIRYSELIVYEKEMDRYNASKNDPISCFEKRKAIEDFGWYTKGKEKVLHKMTRGQIEDRMGISPDAVLREIATWHKEADISKIRFTGINLFEDETYKAGKSCPIGVVSYDHTGKDGSMKKGKFTINEFLL
ncbi:MAG: hypothetical protein KKE23_03160 [Nanoarchaeota archaeon]|nr:hypothetical protein [Nanoarchaeota archaeon]